MDNLFKLTAHELSDMLAKKEISAAELTKSQLDRIDKVENMVDGYLAVFHEDALKHAEEIDKKIASGEELSPLAGIPVGIKDNICTKDVQTTCASKMLYNFKPPYNATVAEKLADSIMVGKTNMDEFAMGSSTENSRFKKTKNPFNTECVPGGSSGGSAAVVSADEAVFALGSDTGGSIRQPASLCGVVGFKPTYGRVSRFGLVAFASSLDQIGTFTKDVRDCALVMNSIAGHDERDSTSLPIGYEDFTKALTGDVKGLKIGIPKEYIGEGIKPEVREAVLKAAKMYEAMGAEVSECSLSMMQYALPTYYMISSAEASSNLARYDGIRFGYRAKDCNELDDVYFKTRSEGFGDEVKRRIMLGTFVLSSGYYDAYYKKAQQVRTLIRDDFNAAFEKYDVLLAPTSPDTAWKFGEKSDDPLTMYAADICTVSINIAGLPAMSLPFGTDSKGLPIGVQIIGKAMGDAAVMHAAHALESDSGYTKIKPVLGGAE